MFRIKQGIAALFMVVVALGCGDDDGVQPDLTDIRAYKATVTCRDDGGTYANQVFTATFEIDIAPVASVGADTLRGTINNFSFDFPRGLTIGNGLGTAFFENEELMKISNVSSGAYGFNGGFTSGQVPDEIESGRWFGYLDEQAVVDGFGTYLIDLGPANIVDYEVTVTCRDDGGTYANQVFTATFEIDIAPVASVGADTLRGAINNFSFDFPRGLTIGNGLGTAFFENGELMKISNVSSGAYGFNGGFTSGQVPDEIESGRWFGYLDEQAVVDGFGTYSIIRLTVR